MLVSIPQSVVPDDSTNKPHIVISHSVKTLTFMFDAKTIEEICWEPSPLVAVCACLGPLFTFLLTSVLGLLACPVAC